MIALHFLLSLQLIISFVISLFHLLLTPSFRRHALRHCHYLHFSSLSLSLLPLPYCSAFIIAPPLLPPLSLSQVSP
jgi:hypothetical protein